MLVPGVQVGVPRCVAGRGGGGRSKRGEGVEFSGKDGKFRGEFRVGMVLKCSESFRDDRNVGIFEKFFKKKVKSFDIFWKFFEKIEKFARTFRIARKRRKYSKKAKNPQQIKVKKVVNFLNFQIFKKIQSKKM